MGETKPEAYKMESKLFEKIWSLPEFSPVNSGIDSNSTGTRIAACFKPNQNEIQVLGPLGNILKTYHGHNKPVTCIRFHPNSDQLASAGTDTTVRIWNPEGGPDRRISYFNDSAEWIDWSADGNFLSACGREGSVLVCDRNGNFVCDLRSARGPLRSVRWSPDSKYLAAASDEGSIWVWNIREQSAGVLRHLSPVLNLVWKPSGEYLVSTCADGIVKVWKTADWDFFELRSPRNTIFVEFSRDGHYLAAGGIDGIVFIYNEEFTKIDELDIGGEVGSLAWTAGENNLVTAVKDGPLSYMKFKA